MSNRIGVALILSAGLTGLACDEAPRGPVPVFPVTGHVTYRGKPVPHALVVLHAPGANAAAPPSKPGDPGAIGPPKPLGTTDDEGKFQIHTYFGNDGAPAGSYRATVVLAGGGETRNVMAKQIVKTSATQIPAKYADPATTDLRVEVKEGPNELEAFDLKGEPAKAGGPTAVGGGAGSARSRD
jgi:hypothetical protein